jgi:hypothetical protein
VSKLTSVSAGSAVVVVASAAGGAVDASSPESEHPAATNAIAKTVP